MPRRRLFWRILPGPLLVAWLAIALLAAFAARDARRFHLDREAGTLEAQARLIALDYSPAAIDSLCRAAARATGLRVSIISPNGRVAGDSEENAAAMESHLSAERTEFLAAREGKVGRALRFSATQERRELYVAVPVWGPAGAVLAVVRVSRPLTELLRLEREADARIGAAALALALLVALLLALMARRL
jgi:two-component system phosphate regulon sensor histidine kinase PhoR